MLRKEHRYHRRTLMASFAGKPNGGLDVNLYPAAFVVQSSITIIGYSVAGFNNAQKVAFRTGIAAEMGTSLAAVEIDGVYAGKVPTDDEMSDKDAKLRRRQLGPQAMSMQLR